MWPVSPNSCVLTSVKPRRAISNSKSLLYRFPSDMVLYFADFLSAEALFFPMDLDVLVKCDLSSTNVDYHDSLRKHESYELANLPTYANVETLNTPAAGNNA